MIAKVRWHPAIHYRKFFIYSHPQGGPRPETSLISWLYCVFWLFPATSPLPPPGMRKRAMDAQDSTSNSKKSSSRASSNALNYFKSTLMSIAQMYADLPVNTPFTVFGQCCTNLHKRKYIFQHGFATDPWVNGVVPHLPHMPTTDLIVAHFTQLPTQHLQRCFTFYLFIFNAAFWIFRLYIRSMRAHSSAPLLLTQFLLNSLNEL